MREIKNPYKLCESVYLLIQSLVKEIGEKFSCQINNDYTKNKEKTQEFTTNGNLNGKLSESISQSEQARDPRQSHYQNHYSKDQQILANIGLNSSLQMSWNGRRWGSVAYRDTDDVSELYAGEKLNMMKHRWEKLEKDFKNEENFDISLIPDIYDCAKYDYLHNRCVRNVQQ